MEVPGVADSMAAERPVEGQHTFSQGADKERSQKLGQNGHGINEEDIGRGSRRKIIEDIPKFGCKQYNGSYVVREKSKGNKEKDPDPFQKGSSFLKKMGHDRKPGGKCGTKEEKRQLPSA